MKPSIVALLLAAGIVSYAASANAQATAPAAPATPAITGSVACKDGTTVPGPSRRGVCAGHGGQAAASRAGSAGTAAPAAATPAARGGGPGQVWVNSASRVYHCEGDKYYGKTRRGQYMSETEAKAAGSHAAGGKACAS